MCVNSLRAVRPLIFDSTTAYYLLQGRSKTNRIFYLSVPQEALLDVASCLASSAQTQKGWNRIIIEKPFGFDALSSQRLTQYLLSKFEEKQLYRYLYLLLPFSPICSCKQMDACLVDLVQYLREKFDPIKNIWFG